MKKIYVLALVAALSLTTACSVGKKDEASSNTASVSSAQETETDTENTEETEEPEVSDGGDEIEDLERFAVNIAKEFTDTYGFDASGEFSESDGIVITIIGEGSSEWEDHAWYEMIDSIGESYEECVTTMTHTGTDETNITYLVCDNDGVSYLRYVNGEVEDLASDSEQAVSE